MNRRNFLNIFILLLIPSFLLRATELNVPFLSYLFHIDWNILFRFKTDFHVLTAKHIILFITMFSFLSVILYQALVNLFSNIKKISSRLSKLISILITLIMTTAGSYLASNVFIKYSAMITDSQFDYSPALFFYPLLIESVFFSIVISLILTSIIIFLWSRFKKDNK